MELKKIENILDGMREMMVLLKKNVVLESWGAELGAEEQSEVQSALSDARDAIEKARRAVSTE